MKTLTLIIALAITPRILPMDAVRPSVAKLPEGVEPYSVKQLVSDLRAQGKVEEIMFEDPKAPGFSIINLNDRRLTDLSGLFTVLPDSDEKPVWKICANNNYISQIPSASLAKYKKLEALELKNNLIASLGNKVKHLSFAEVCPRCTWIDLSQNKIKLVYADTFAKMRELAHLNLAKNDICAIDDRAFRTLLKLEVLFLNDNKLANISSNLFAGLYQLETLSLANNYLKSEEDFQFPSRTEVTFDPQKDESFLPILNEMNLALIKKQTTVQAIQFISLMPQEFHKPLLDQASADAQAKEKIEVALKIFTTTELMKKAEDLEILKRIVQKLSSTEQDLILETARDEVKAKFTIALFELSGKKGLLDPQKEIE